MNLNDLKELFKDEESMEKFIKIIKEIENDFTPIVFKNEIISVFVKGKAIMGEIS